MSSLTIDTTFTTNDSVSFEATYTSATRIVLTLTVDGSGNYFIGAPLGTITNDTGASFPSFYAILVGAPAGVDLVEASWNGDAFSNGVVFGPASPDTTEVTFNGPPGIGAGASTSLGVGFTIPGSVAGSQTFEVVLTPSVASVPEPSTFVLGLIGALGLAEAARRSRRPASGHGRSFA